MLVSFQSSVGISQLKFRYNLQAHHLGGLKNLLSKSRVIKIIKHKV